MDELRSCNSQYEFGWLLFVRLSLPLSNGSVSHSFCLSRCVFPFVSWHSPFSVFVFFFVVLFVSSFVPESCRAHQQTRVKTVVD
jgi:hypothetical protein